jgi:hypothetical protein
VEEIIYLAITKMGTTKENPLYIARQRGLTFEKYSKGEWIPDPSIEGIPIGEFIDYEYLTEQEAKQIIHARS